MILEESLAGFRMGAVYEEVRTCDTRANIDDHEIWNCGIMVHG